MQIEDFNTMSEAAASATVRPCAAIDSWVQALVAGRPYASVAELSACATARAATWTGAEVQAALADHPRIGERPSGDGASAAMSRREQSTVDGDDADLARRLAEGNRRYEETFDRIYLVRAAGRSAEDILALLEERLTHDPETELAVTAGQLAEVAVLRLEGLFT
ncbi:2-oxo-4-hydroxy-4-carboxy-5-ureidoimidazoline decarboxylase [Rhodococcus sp. X156]|uniref:2-oxo-4-hydroxy-4-carboxy-5-ureidoimidazoline decarboxylase n=1 Tax=Rhodococcus sp. X156 TaxID=2499145 RepID=UPI000FD98392|nr:2-oxo-4-hydroxy-4-carboxy-5-ureidoimidazoline decarboxylase [Rhodococcus sp. X156]